MHPSVQPDVLRTELSGSVYYLVSSDRGTSAASRSFDDFRDLRNRVDMLDYNIREANKALNAVRAGCKRVLADVEKANEALAARENDR